MSRPDYRNKQRFIHRNKAPGAVAPDLFGSVPLVDVIKYSPVSVNIDPLMFKYSTVSIQTLPASDDFGGVGTNSGTVGDANWNLRWPNVSTSSQGTVSIVGGKLKLTELVATDDIGATVDNYGEMSVSGDFDFTVDYEAISFLAPPSSAQTWFFFFTKRDQPTDNLWGLGYLIESNNGGRVRSFANGISQFHDTGILNSDTTGQFRVRRVSGTAYNDLNTGSGWVNKSASATTAPFTGVQFYASTTVAGTGGDIDVEFDNLVMVDGNSDPVYLLT